MTKDQMVALLGSAGVTQEIITAMEQAYEMGFERGADVGEVIKGLVEEAESICNQVDEDAQHIATGGFWALFKQLKDLA